MRMNRTAQELARKRWKGPTKQRRAFATWVASQGAGRPRSNAPRCARGESIDVMGPIDPVRALSITRVYVRAFVDESLKGMPSTLLKGRSPDYPEVTSFKDAVGK